jgi:CubicO group peptidase (beta-lactamase class C family)
MKSLHPVTSAFNMPIYANPTFQILAYAIESMTNKSFAEVFRSTIVGPLNLNSTSLGTPAVTKCFNAIIPGDEIQSGWKLDPGDDASSALVLARCLPRRAQ